MVLAYGARKLGEVLTKEALKKKDVWALVREKVFDWNSNSFKTSWRIFRGNKIPDDMLDDVAATVKKTKGKAKSSDFFTKDGYLKRGLGPGTVANPGSRTVFRDLLGDPKAIKIMRDRERLGLGTGAGVIGAISLALGLSLEDSEDFINYYEVMEGAAKELGISLADLGRYTGPLPKETGTDRPEKPELSRDEQAAEKARILSGIPPKPIDPSLDPDIAQEPGFGFGIDQLRIDKEEKAIREAFESRLGQDMLEAAEAPQRFPSSGLGERPGPDLRRRTSPTLEDSASAEDMLGRLLGLSRSKSEIERDMAYTQLKEEELLGLQPDTRTQFEVADKVYSDPNEYWDAWNANRKAELDGGDEKKSGGRVLKKKVKKKVSRSYKPKSTKKQYAKNNSVRKPKRI